MLGESLLENGLVLGNESHTVLLGNRNETGGIRIPSYRVAIDLVMFLNSEAVKHPKEDQI